MLMLTLLPYGVATPFFHLQFVLNIKLNLDGQGRQPPVVTAQPPTAQPPAASHQLFAAIAASRLHT